jgi:hypothetical protein
MSQFCTVSVRAESNRGKKAAVVDCLAPLNYQVDLMKKLTDLQIRILEKQLVGCDDVTELLGDYVEGELSPSLGKRVVSHIKRCECCREMEESYRFTIQLAREIKSKPLPVGVQNRLRKALNERLGLTLALID